MKTSLGFSLICLFAVVTSGAFAQNGQISTIFKKKGTGKIHGFVAASNKFTSVRGKYANMVELYGGWYIKHRLLIGGGVAVMTNEMRVPEEHWTPGMWQMYYHYGQIGAMTEYVFASDRAVHVALQMFGGKGVTLQYEQGITDYDDYWNNNPPYDDDQNWFTVLEPGVKVEVNIFRWMRFCPGLSYRITSGSAGRGMTDKNLSGSSLNLTLKFGKF